MAERKCEPLVRAGARVTVISPRITMRLGSLSKEGEILHLRRSYRKGDLNSAFLVIVATDSEETNRKVAADAGTGNVLLNVADNPSLCNFTMPSVLRRGRLTIAVSTGGVSPAMARTIRRELASRFGSRFSAYLRFLKGVRMRAMREIPEKKKRERFLKGLASEEMIGILESEGVTAAKREANRLRKTLIV